MFFQILSKYFKLKSLFNAVFQVSSYTCSFLFDGEFDRIVYKIFKAGRMCDIELIR